MKIFLGLYFACLALIAVVCEPPASNYLPASEYGLPKGFSNQDYNNINNLLGSPSSGEESDFGNKIQTPSQTYGPSQNQQSQYTATGSSQSYGASQQAQYTPSGSSDYQNSLQSQAYSPDSSQYGAPQSQYGAPQSQYGAPQSQYGAPSGSNSYDNEDQYEPASYQFGYVVKDDKSGTDFGHKEARQGDYTQGTYYVVLPDGRKQIVEYEADKDGYRPKITYEEGYPKYAGNSGGYGGNADLGYPGSQNGGELIGNQIDGGYSY